MAAATSAAAARGVDIGDAGDFSSANGNNGVLSYGSGIVTSSMASSMATGMAQYGTFGFDGVAAREFPDYQNAMTSLTSDWSFGLGPKAMSLDFGIGVENGKVSNVVLATRTLII